MAKGAKQESRKTVWRGISVKAETRPISPQSQEVGRTSVSWEKPPLSPLGQQEFIDGIKTPPDTPKPEEHLRAQQASEDQQQGSPRPSTSAVSPSNSTTVASTKSSTRSSQHKKEKLAGLGSLTKTVEPSHKRKDSKSTFGNLAKSYQQDDKRAQKELERKERKEREKLERQERKEQEKLEKERKEQEKKQLKEQAKELKLLKEKERKERKTRVKSSLFSRSSKSSALPKIDTNSNGTSEDKAKSPVERRSLLSFGRHSLASLTSKPSNTSTIDVVVPEPTEDAFGETDTDDSSSEEFLDFVDSQMSIHSNHSNISASSAPHSAHTNAQVHQQVPTSSPSPSSPTSPLHPRPQLKTPKLLEHLQQQPHLTSSRYSTNSSTSSITSSNNKNSSSTTPSHTNHSMLYILNSLQDAGRDIEDDDLLDDLAENKMEETQRLQRQSRLSISHQRSSSQGQQELDQHIKALEIIANRTSASPPPTDPLPPIPADQRAHRHTRSFGDTNRFSVDSYHSSHQQHYSPALSAQFSTASPRMSHCSSISNCSYDTVAQADANSTSLFNDSHLDRQPTMSSHYEITAITEEDLVAATNTPNLTTPDPVRSNVDSILDRPVDSNNEINDNDSIISEDNQHDLTDSSSFKSVDILDSFMDPPDDEETDRPTKDNHTRVEIDVADDQHKQETSQSISKEDYAHTETTTEEDNTHKHQHETNQSISIEDHTQLESTLEETKMGQHQQESSQLVSKEDHAHEEITLDDEKSDEHQLKADTISEEYHTQAKFTSTNDNIDQCHHDSVLSDSIVDHAQEEIDLDGDKIHQHQREINQSTKDSEAMDSQWTHSTEKRNESSMDIEVSSSTKKNDIQLMDYKETVKTQHTIDDVPLIESLEVKTIEDSTDQYQPLASGTSKRKSTLQITTSYPSSTPTLTVDEPAFATYTEPGTDHPTSPILLHSPSSPIAAAAAVTASKRSSLMSAKRNSTHSISTPLERHSPVYMESPLAHLSTTSTPIGTSSPDTNITKIEPTTKDKIAPNFLGPREQEESDQPIRQGMNYLFGNKFTKAMSIFKSKAESEPLHALGLGSMLFLKAMMTYNEQDVDGAMESLTHSYTIANTQAGLSKVEESFDDTFSSHFSSLMATTDERSSTKTFKPNGVLRAQVIEAESCLLMGILQLTQETMTGYLKCGLNFRKACASYKLVWAEYQAMGDQVSQWMDKDTALAVQFGVGTLHLLLSSLPEKIAKIFPGLVWKTDRAMGLTLLKSVMTGKGTRSSFGSLMLLSYYSLLSSSVPSIYAQESIQPTIECLVAAQKSHPKSCFFLYYAARISRVARNVGLSTQSFTMATASTRKAAWAEVAMKHTVAYEVGLNHAMQLDWDTSAAYFEQLCCARDWSPAFCQYFVGACHEMLGQRQEAKDAFDEVPVLSHQQHHRKSLLDNYVQSKVEQYQYHDYRDLDSSLPGLELLLLLNAFASMEDTYLKRCLEMVQETCQLIKIGGMVNLDDDNDGDTSDDSASDYGSNNSNDKNTMVARYGTLLLTKCAVLNALSRYDECIADLDWLVAKKQLLESEEWLIPFIYWEAGVTHWGMEDRQKSRHLWQLALSCTSYDFEYRMASRIHLAFAKCDELGVLEPSNSTAHVRKRI